MKYMGQQYGSASHAEAIVAVQTIGTNALPYLLELLEGADGRVKRSVAQTMRGWRMDIPQGLMQFAGPMCWQATTAFRILGTNGAVATEALEKLKLKSDGQPASVALILSGFGTNSAEGWFKDYHGGNSVTPTSGRE